MEFIENIFSGIILLIMFISICLTAGIPIYAIYSSLVFSKRASRFEFTDKYNKKYRTTKEKIIDLTVWFGSGFLTICLIYLLFFHYAIGIGIWKGHTPKIYERAIVHSNGYISLPSNPEDLRVYGENWVRGAYSAAAFSLHGNDYDEFITAIDKKYKLHLDEAPRFENDFTGKSVAELIEYYNDEEKYLGLEPNTRHIKYVLDDDIKQYTVLYYDFMDTETHLIATNPKTGRYVICNGGYD